MNIIYLALNDHITNRNGRQNQNENGIKYKGFIWKFWNVNGKNEHLPNLKDQSDSILLKKIPLSLS